MAQSDAFPCYLSEREALSWMADRLGRAAVFGYGTRARSISGNLCSVASDGEPFDVRDAFAIRALCERYALAVDAGDLAAFTSVFTPDGHLWSDYRGVDTDYNGHEELEQVVVRAKALAPTTMHLIGNHLAQPVGGDDATGITYCIAHHLREDRTDLVMMVRYLDRYRRAAEDDWLIADRRVEVLWTETRQVDPPSA